MQTMTESSESPQQIQTPLEKLIQQAFHLQTISKLNNFIKSPSNYISQQTNPLKPYYFLQLSKFTEKQLNLSSYYILQIILLAKALCIILSSQAFSVQLLSASPTLPLLNALIVLAKKLKGTQLAQESLIHFRVLLNSLLQSPELTSDEKSQVEDLMLHSDYHDVPLLKYLPSHPDWTQICLLAKNKDINTRIQAVQKFQDLLSYAVSYGEQLSILESDEFQTCWGNLLEQPPSYQSNVAGNPWELLIKEICRLLTSLIGQFEFIIKHPKMMSDTAYWVILSNKQKFFSSQISSTQISNFITPSVMHSLQQCSKLSLIIPSFCLQILAKYPQSSLILSQLINILQRVYTFCQLEELALDSPLVLAVKQTFILIESQDDILQKKEASMFLWKIMKDNSVLANELKTINLESLKSNSYYSEAMEQNSFWKEEAQPIEDLVMKTGIPTQLQVPAGEMWSQFIQVNNAGDIIYIGFAVQYYDIVVSLTRVLSFDKMEVENTLICKEKKVGTNGEPVKLIIAANQAGIYKLNFSNQYSWYTGKIIRIRVWVLENQTIHKPRVNDKMTENVQVIEQQKSMEIRQIFETPKKEQQAISNPTSTQKKILNTNNKISAKFVIVMMNEQIEFQLKSEDKKVEIGFEFNISKISKSRIQQKINDFLKKMSLSQSTETELILSIILIYNEKQFKNTLTSLEINYNENQLKEHFEELFGLNQFLTSSIDKLNLSYQFFKDIEFIYFSDAIQSKFQLQRNEQLAIIILSLSFQNDQPLNCTLQSSVFPVVQGAQIDSSSIYFQLPNSSTDESQIENTKTFKECFQECNDQQKLFELLSAFIQNLFVTTINLQHIIILEEQEAQYFAKQENIQQFKKIFVNTVDQELITQLEITEKIHFENCIFNDLIN